MRSRPGFLWVTVAAAVVLLAMSPATRAETFEVGPGKEFAQVADVLPMLSAGDVVEIQGNATYEPFDFRVNAEAGNPITLRGVLVDGKRPVFSGGEDTIILYGNHVVLENVEVTGGSAICIVHKADDVTIRNTVVHDCPGHGILGTDEESGSLTIEYSEIYHCGSGESHHQLYIATDAAMYPGSVFRLQHTYIHDGNGGNNVKSRAERNEIYYNWIEGAAYHELDLIGPDGAPTDLAREDSDVIGNVLIKSSEWFIARIGGDGTGETNGRYRFAWNTMVMGASDVPIKAQDGLESIELYNNVVVSGDGQGVRLVSAGDAIWVAGESIVGGHNWLPSGSDEVGTSDNILGSDPDLEDLATDDVRPRAASVLIDAAINDTPGAAGHAFPLPEALPLFLPPLRHIVAVGAATPRPQAGAGLDLGAIEFGTGPPVMPPDPPAAGDGSEVAGGCQVSPGGPAPAGLGIMLGLALLLRLRRRRRS
jgi:MYXO-CTERM domain-containing protein